MSTDNHWKQLDLPNASWKKLHSTWCRRVISNSRLYRIYEWIYNEISGKAKKIGERHEETTKHHPRLFLSIHTKYSLAHRTPHTSTPTMMLKGGIRQFARRNVLRTAVRAESSHIKGASNAGKGPIGMDGRHEIWREDIYDHDNEPK